MLYVGTVSHSSPERDMRLDSTRVDCQKCRLLTVYSIPVIIVPILVHNDCLSIYTHLRMFVPCLRQASRSAYKFLAASGHHGVHALFSPHIIIVIEDTYVRISFSAIYETLLNSAHETFF